MKTFKFEIVAKLANGSDVIFEGDFLIGTPVFVLDEQGNKVSAPDAEHELEGGQKFKTEGGVITEIMVEETVTEEVVEETVLEEEIVEEVIEDETPAVDAISAKIAELEQKIAELDAKIAQFNETFELKKEQKMASMEFEKEETVEVKSNDIYSTLHIFLNATKK